MKSYNYERVGLILKHINEREEKKVEPLELISFYLPSLYELNLVYNKTLKGKYHNISIDMQSKELKGALRKAYELKNEQDYTNEMIYNYLARNEVAKENKRVKELKFLVFNDIRALIPKSEILNKYSISSEDYKIFHHQFIEDCKKDKKWV